MSAAGKGGGKSAALSRSQARLAAVQALYQMDLAETDLAAVIEEFKAHRLGSDLENGTAAQADPEHFADLLKGVVRRQRDIDPMIDRQLAEGWRLTRIDFIVRAILRAAAFELMELEDVPPGSSYSVTSRWRMPSSRATSPGWSTACSTAWRASCAPASCRSGGEIPSPHASSGMGRGLG